MFLLRFTVLFVLVLADAPLKLRNAINRLELHFNHYAVMRNKYPLDSILDQSYFDPQKDARIFKGSASCGNETWPEQEQTSGTMEENPIFKMIDRIKIRSVINTGWINSVIRKDDDTFVLKTDWTVWRLSSYMLCEMTVTIHNEVNNYAQIQNVDMHCPSCEFDEAKYKLKL